MNMHAHTLVVVLICMTVLPVTGRERKPEPTGTIAGEIIDSRTHMPVAGALVSIISSDVIDTTDSTGDFSFEGVEVGRIDLSDAGLTQYLSSKIFFVGGVTVDF